MVSGRAYPKRWGRSRCDYLVARAALGTGIERAEVNWLELSMMVSIADEGCVFAVLRDDLRPIGLDAVTNNTAGTRLQ